MYKSLNIEIVYLYIIINNYLNKPSKKSKQELIDFFEGNSLFHKKMFNITKTILADCYKLSSLYSLFKKDICHLEKFREVLKIYTNI